MPQLIRFNPRALKRSEGSLFDFQPPLSLPRPTCNADCQPGNTPILRFPPGYPHAAFVFSEIPIVRARLQSCRRNQPTQAALAAEVPHLYPTPKKTKTAPNQAPSSSFSLRENSLLTSPMAAETPESLVAAAHSPVADPGRARVVAQSNGWRVQYARAARCHSSARAAAAEPGYR